MRTFHDYGESQKTRLLPLVAWGPARLRISVISCFFVIVAANRRGQVHCSAMIAGASVVCSVPNMPVLSPTE
jgi:hypothetical protein